MGFSSFHSFSVWFVRGAANNSCCSLCYDVFRRFLLFALFALPMRGRVGIMPHRLLLSMHSILFLLNCDAAVFITRLTGFLLGSVWRGEKEKENE